MDKKEIIAAISNPTLVRRVFSLLWLDPGPLELVSEGTAQALGREITYRIYHHGQDYILAANCEDMGPFAAIVASVLRLGKYSGQAGMLDSHFGMQCLAVVVNDNLDTYCVNGYPIVSEEIRPDGTQTEETVEGTTGWFAISLGQNIGSMEEVVQDMETRLRGD